MSLDFTLVLRAETTAAKAEIEAAARGVQGVGAATDKATASSKAGAAAATAEAAARRGAAQANQAYTRSTQMATGATGNLVAQFNDIGMMLAAGQNPLQLAIQQGTQITQVIGPMGAAGAVQALGAAFLQMLNPMNLVFIAGLAGGAAMIQWLMSAGEEAVTLEDRIKAVTDAVKNWRDESGRSLDDLRETFGAVTPELVAMQRELNALRIADIMREADAAAKQLRDSIGDGFFNTEVGEVAGLLGFDPKDVRAGLDPVVREIRALLSDLGNASGVGEQLAAVEALRTRFAEITGGVAGMNEEQRAFYQSVLNTEAALRAAAVATGDVATESDSAAAAAEVLSRAAQKVVSTLNAADGSRLTAAFQAAFPVASQLLGMAQDIVATIGQAQAAAAAQDQLDQMAIEFSPGGQALTAYGGRTPGGTAAQNALGSRNQPVRTPGGGGGAGAAREEASALQELITGLEGEIAALRVTNPIQAEMLQHREALTGATEAERQKVEELIATREREALLMEGAKARAEFFEDIGTQALESLIVKGESFNDVLKNIVNSLIQAGIQGALFGSGPFGSLFGGQSLLSGLFGPGKAEGGMVYGPGTSKSDSILTPLSNGEFVVNARATARNRQLLEAINAGGRTGPGRAAGGPIGDAGGTVTGRSGRQMPATIMMDLRGVQGDQAIEAKIRKGAAAMISVYDREGVPVAFQRVSRDQKRRG